MRTNPFLDAWLFLIGSTDDHNALGLFKYVFVALFLLLLAASAWIAIIIGGKIQGSAKDRTRASSCAVS
jgi:hypothetical protein